MAAKRKPFIEPYQFGRICKCGHSMGFHAMRRPYACLCVSAKAFERKAERCGCKGFENRPLKKRRR